MVGRAARTGGIRPDVSAFVHGSLGRRPPTSAQGTESDHKTDSSRDLATDPGDTARRRRHGPPPAARPASPQLAARTASPRAVLPRTEPMRIPDLSEPSGGPVRLYGG